MLEFEKLSIRRGKLTITEPFDLTLQTGRVYTVLGPNGAGKSSLLKAVFGEIPHGGRIAFENETLGRANITAWRKRIGYMPQHSHAEASLTALEVVLLGRMDALHMHIGDDTLAEAAAALDTLGLGHLAHRDILSLSGGQRQLVMFAQVMVRRPKILLLDEPVSALDMHHQINLLENVCSHTRSEGLVTLMVLHDLSLAAQFSDGLILLGNGNIQAFGTPQQVLQAPLLSRLYRVDVEILSDRNGLPVIRPLRNSAQPAAGCLSETPNPT